jgi:hypothetical protein
MNYTRFGSNLVSNFYLNSVRIQAGHVAVFRWPVPVRLDQASEP